MVPLAGTLRAVSSRHPRIQVPRDPELKQAIDRGRQLVGVNAPASQVVRALALRGAEALSEEHEAERRAQEFMASAAEGNSGIDLESLRTVRHRAWR